MRRLAAQLIQDPIGDGLLHVARFSPDGDKIMRLHAQSAVIENGFVFVPEEAPWLADYVSELTTFPAGRHDDQVELDGAGAGLGEGEARDGGGGVDRVLSATGGGGVRVTSVPVAPEPAFVLMSSPFDCIELTLCVFNTCTLQLPAAVRSLRSFPGQCG